MNVLFALLLLSTSAFATLDASTSLDLFEKSWARANSFCTHKNRRIELLVRGGGKFTETKERGYGEYIFYRVKEKAEIFSFSRPLSTLYHFLQGHDGICSKSLGYPIEGDKFALLFAEEYRPHGDKLLIQLFDFKKMIPLETIHTNLIVDKAYGRPGGFIFKTHPERFDMDMGYVTLEGQKFTYQDRVFPVWMTYSAKGTSLEPETTFKKLPWKKYFKDLADFYKHSAYDSAKNAFANNVVYYAVQHQIKKRCVVFVDKRRKLEPTEDWHCQTTNAE